MDLAGTDVGEVIEEYAALRFKAAPKEAQATAEDDEGRNDLEGADATYFCRSRQRRRAPPA